MIIKSLSSNQIALVMKKGRAYNAGSFVFKYLEGENILNNSLINGSFISTKKNFNKAVDRNKAKRIIKNSFTEAFNSLPDDLKNNFSKFNFVFLPKNNVDKIVFSELLLEIKQILLNNRKKGSIYYELIENKELKIIKIW